MILCTLLSFELERFRGLLAATAFLCEIIILVDYVQNGRYGYFDSLVGYKLGQNINGALHFLRTKLQTIK